MRPAGGMPALLSAPALFRISIIMLPLSCISSAAAGSLAASASGHAASITPRRTGVPTDAGSWVSYCGFQLLYVTPGFLFRFELHAPRHVAG
jgi:hypothetical protein